MKMKCTIGGLSCNGVSVRRGDVFEMDDGMAALLIASGDAVNVMVSADKSVVDEPATDKKTGGKKTGGGK